MNEIPPLNASALLKRFGLPARIVFADDLPTALALAAGVALAVTDPGGTTYVLGGAGQKDLIAGKEYRIDLFATKKTTATRLVMTKKRRNPISRTS